MEVSRGVRALRQLLAEKVVDLRGLDLAGFRRWLVGQVAHWQNDPVFAQQARIRDLRRAHPELYRLEKAYRRAVSADAAAPQFEHLRALERESAGTTKALAGLTAALEGAGPAKRPALRLKMQAFQARQQALREELDLLIQASLPRQSLLRITAELQRLRSALGLDHAEARLAQLRKQHGRCSGRAGHSFERQALALSREYIVPDLFRRRSTASADRLRILTGVTLGAARTEFDQVLIQQPRGRQCLVDVLAVVEVKRNINDLAHGFRRRQENLAWLTGASAHYDPALYRTGLFRSGHFDREAIHQEGGESYRFDPGSFHRFRRDPAAGMFLDRLYLITQTGMMWGLSSAAMARFRFRVATDEHWEPDLDSCLLPLWRWFQALAEPIETPDLLRIYCLSARRGQQVLVKGPVAANQ